MIKLKQYEPINPNPDYNHDDEPVLTMAKLVRTKYAREDGAIRACEG
jgi:hypothetical protein